MTAIPERQTEEAVGFDPPETRAEAQTHAQRAKSVPSALPTALPLPDASEPDGDSPSPSEAARARILASLAPVIAAGRRAMDREFDVIHGPPPTLAAMHARHQGAAARWNGAAPKGLRLAWGLLHTAVAAIVYAALDAAFSPAGAILAVLFIFLALNWL